MNDRHLMAAIRADPPRSSGGKTMTTCKIVEITPPVTPPTPAERTFTLTVTGQELQHLRATLGAQRGCDYHPVLRVDMFHVYNCIDNACRDADIPRISYVTP